MRTIDDSRAPLLVVTLPAHVTPEWLDHHKEDCLAIIARGEPYAYLYDLRVVSKGIDAGNRQKAGELIAVTREGTERLSKGVAFVTTSTLIRGVLRAIFWVQPNFTPHRVFPTVAEAEAWVVEQLEQAGVKVSPKDRAAS